MALTLPIQADLAFLAALGGPAGINLTVRLHKSPAVPSSGDTVAVFDECDYSGYAPYNGAGWTVPATDITGASYILGPALTFTQTGTGVVNTAYRWTVEALIDGTVYLIDHQVFPVAISMDHIGATAPLQVVLVHKAC